MQIELDELEEYFQEYLTKISRRVRFHKVASSVQELLSTLSFGAFGPILDIHLPTDISDIA